MRSIRARLVRVVIVCGLLFVAAVTIAPVVGSTTISLRRVFDATIPFADNVDAQIFYIARLPRVLAAALVGAALSAAGVTLQALLRNPLATPDTLGVSSGAALGAMIAITFHLDFVVGGVSSIPLASFAGSVGALGVVYALSSARRRGLSTMVLLLGGVTLQTFFSALILFVQYLADFTDTSRTVRWLMGTLDVGSYTPILAVLPVVAVAFAILATLPRALDLVSVGADAAAARGVDVVRAERLALVSASLATASAVSLAGPVGFIGLVVPHLMRLFVGSDHRLVLPASVLFGGAFLIACDLVARTVFAPIELPVGIVTALIGGPFFLWLLLRAMR